MPLAGPQFPNTPSTRVFYNRDGVQYHTVIQTPASYSDFQQKLLARQIGVSQVMRFEPVQPRQDLHRTHPAHNHLTRYANMADR